MYGIKCPKIKRGDQFWYLKADDEALWTSNASRGIRSITIQ